MRNILIIISFLQVMMVEETVWENHEQCEHSYDKRCHKSYTTAYTSVQVRKLGSQQAFQEFTFNFTAGGGM